MTEFTYTTTRLGKLYQGDPLPVDTGATTYHPAGAVTFGVEGRALFKDGENAPWAGGPTLHVFGTATGREHLRFDAFPGEEHYHYLTPGVQNHWVGYDSVADGDFITWILDRITSKLPELLRFAGATELAAEVDPATVATVVDELHDRLRSHDLRLNSTAAQ